MSKVLKLDELSQKTQEIVKIAYESADLDEELYNKLMTEGITADEWKDSPLAVYFGGNAAPDFAGEGAPQEKPAQIVEEIDDAWYKKIQQTMGVYEEEILRIEVRRRDPVSRRLIYVKGGTIRWNLFTQSYTEILDMIGENSGSGEYNLKFYPDNKDVKFAPFYRTEHIEVTSKKKIESFIQPIQIPTTKESFDPEKLTTSMANIFVNIFKDFRMEMKETNSIFQSQMQKNQSDTIMTVKELANAIRYSKNQPQGNQGNANMDVLAALEKLTEISARINKPQQPQAPVDIQAAISRGIKDHMNAVEYGMKIGQAQVSEEDEFEPEPEEPKKEEPKSAEPVDDIDFDQPIEGILGDVVKSELTGNVRDVIRGAISWLKDKAQAQPAAVQQEISEQRVPKHVEEMVKVGGIETTKGDLKILMYYINEVEKRLKTQADMDIVRWLRGQLAPDLLPRLAGVNKQYLTLAINSLKPSLAPEIDRILRIIKMTTVDIKPKTP